MISLNTNVSAMNSSRLLNITNASLEKTTERLSSGLRINRAADDASGLFAAESLTSTIRGNQAASGNIQSAVALAGVADAGLAGLTDVLQRMRELAVAGNNELLTTDQRNALSSEYISLRATITQMINSVTWGGSAVLGGTFADAQLQVGSVIGAIATVDIANYSATALPGTANLSSTANASAAVTQIDTALTTVNNGRAQIGSQISALEYQKAAIDSAVVAAADARSRIRDADVATEVSNLVRQQILQQAGASALSAANFSAQFVLQLLK